MTPRELAEKIVNYMNEDEDYIPHIEALLSEALEESFRKGRKEMFAQWQQVAKVTNNDEAVGYIQGHIAGEHYQEEKWFKRGQLAAYEDAAKIVEGFNLPDGNEFYWYKQREAAVKEIRKRAEEMK